MKAKVTPEQFAKSCTTAQLNAALSVLHAVAMADEPFKIMAQIVCECTRESEARLKDMQEVFERG